MPHSLRIFLALPTFSLTLSLLLTGCSPVGRTVRLPTDQGPLPVKTATRSELINRVNGHAKSIESLKLKVSYEFTGGTVETGKIRQWRESEGFILLRRPCDIRVLIYALFRVRVIDMVSDCTEFSIEVPPKNKFIRGRNDQVFPRRKDIPVNARPQHIFEALAIPPLDESDPALIAVEEDQTQGRKFYILSCHRWSSEGILELKRKIWLDRSDLNIVRQRTYAEGGKLAGDMVYGDMRSVDGHVYPARIHLSRPQEWEAYSLLIRTEKIQLNVDLDDEVFVLNKLPTSEELDLTREPLPQTLG